MTTQLCKNLIYDSMETQVIWRMDAEKLTDSEIMRAKDSLQDPEK
ncbi:MAG: gas vesicle protein GvpK [Pseudanabaena sp.]|jgi:hypothetical protein|nr:gas vesicle protein K [Pseudanabaena sp. M53BS1SP1A06MG]